MISDPRPVRLQLSRRKGFSLHALSIMTNGLPAVDVARSSKWGNPYKVGEELASTPFVDDDYPARHFRTAEEAVECFRDMLPYRKDLDASELRGKNIACFCALDRPCHGDVLLALANPLRCEDAGS